MTGFGSAEGEVGSVRVSVEVRSVNHRFFNPSLKLPSSFSRWEPEVRELLRERIPRGHVTLTLRIESETDTGVAIHDAAFAAAVERLRALRDRHGLEGDVDIGTVLRVPGVVASGEEAVLPETANPLLAVVGRAADALTAARDAEGVRLAAIISERLGVADETIKRIAERAPARIAAHREKLRASIRELADGIAVDEQRLALEVAVLAERLDVGEELDRFGSHVAAFREALETRGSEPVGKRLGFLLQEMLREANTTGSKANDAAMQRDVVALKEELERIREQVENVE